MGAAWVLKTNYCSILTKDMRSEDMKGVVNTNTIFIKVDVPEAKARLNEMKNTLIEVFGLNPKSDSFWERKRDQFIEVANKLS
jgi:hypothetical protein